MAEKNTNNIKDYGLGDFNTFGITQQQTMGFINPSDQNQADVWISELNASIALGDVATIAELGKVVLQNNKFNTQDNLEIIERAKYLAAAEYEKKTGKPFIPSSEDQVVVNFNDEADVAILKDKDEFKKAKEKAFSNISSGGYWAEVKDEEGNTAYIPAIYTNQYSKDPNSVKKYTEQEKLIIDADIVKKTVGTPKTPVKTKQGDKWVITGTDGKPTEYATEEEANTAYDVALGEKETLDNVLSGLGVDTEQINEEIVSDELEAGAEYKAALLQFASRNGINLTDDRLTNFSKEIAAGTKSLEGVQQFLRETELISRYPAWEEKIKEGYNILDIANPYIEAMADTFELASIDGNELLKDSLIQQALSNVGVDGKASYMPLWEFEQKLKQDDRYYQTNKSHNEMAGLAAAIGQTFGMI